MERKMCIRDSCPVLFLSTFLKDEIPQEHKDGLDMVRDYLRRSHVLVVCGHGIDETVKNDIGTAERLRITATTLDGILTVKGQGLSLIHICILEASKYVPLDRLCLSPLCGFASTEEGNKLTEEDQWKKLALIREIAEEVWG